MWYQPVDPLNNVWYSTALALFPIAVLAGLLLSRKVGGHIAALAAVGAAFLVAVMGYEMPVDLAGLSVLYGILNGLLPIGWIVLNAVFLYNLSVANGSFAIVRDSIESITADRRLQALLIAFCFGAFLEGAAGFGAPVAITAGMLMGLGFEPLYAATICLLANTAPVAFGGIGIAVVTAGHVTGIDPNVISRMIGHQLPFIALVIPLWLVLIIAGWRGAKEVWPALATAGIAYALTMYLTASFLGPTLPDILSSIVSLIALTALLHVWRPQTVWRFPHEPAVTEHARPHAHSAWDVARAWTPFLLLIIFIVNWALPGQQSILQAFSLAVPFGELHRAIVVNGSMVTVTYAFAWLSAAGTAILFAALCTALCMRMSWHTVARVAGETLNELKYALLTIASVVGFAYIANYSGMSATLAAALSATGYVFPLLAPLLGWLGVFLTGSDTSSNALFANVQQKTAQSLGLNPVLTVAANSSGGVAAKMISPQSIAVATASTGLVGREGELFRRALPHSLGIVALICVLTFLQAYAFPWMIPDAQSGVAVAAAHFSTPDALGVALSLAACAALFVLNRKGSVHAAVGASLAETSAPASLAE